MPKFGKNIIIIIAAFFTAILGMHRMPQLLVIFALMLGFVIFVRKTAARDMQKMLIALFLASFILQVAISMTLYNTTVGTKFYGFSAKGDDYVYGDFGTIVGDLWRRGIFPTLKGLEYYNLIGEHVEVEKYQLYNAFIFFLFGPCGGQILLILNCFFHTAIIVPVYFICMSLKMKARPMLFTMILFLLWPSTLYWSLFNFREPAALFILFIVFTLAVRVKENPTLSRGLLLALFLLLLYYAKKYLFVVFIAVLFYLLIYRKFRLKKTLIISFVSLLMSIGFFKKGLLQHIYDAFGMMPTTLYSIRHPGKPNFTDYFTNILTPDWLSTMLYFPLGIFAAVFFPFMLIPLSLSHVLVNMESIIWWCLLPFLINGIRICAKKHLESTFHILFTFIAWLVMLALTQGNMGTLLRQKSFLYYMAFIFIGVAIDRNYRKDYEPKEIMNSLYISYNAITEPITQSQVIPYLEGLSKKGISFSLLTFEKKKDRSPAPQSIKWFSMYYHKWPSGPAKIFDILSGFTYTVFIVLKHDIQVIHARAIVAALIGYPVAKLFRKKFIFDTRGIDSEEYVDAGLWKRGGFKHKIISFLEGVITKSSDHVVVLTNKFLNILEAKYGADKIKYTVIPCAVDTAKFKLERKPDAGKFVFVYTGSIGTWYMLREMLEFFKCARKVMKNTHFLILTQSEFELVRNMIGESGLDMAHVTIDSVPHGSMPARLALCNAGIFFIKPVFSKLSSSPTKFAEYLASGFPVIINSGIGDTEEMVRANRIGVVVESFTASGYNKAIAELTDLLKDPNLSARCRQTAEKYLSLEEAIGRYNNIYNSL